MYPHRIRLRGPWQCEPAAAPLRIVPMPCRWGEVGMAGFGGRVRCRRRFGYPGRVDAHERVWLTFAGVSDRAEVSLNDTPLGRVEGAVPAEFDVTALLRPRNEVVADVEGPAAEGGLWGEVALEVRCTAFLRDVHARVKSGDRAELHVTGMVVGSAEGPLDLYAILGRRPVAEAQVTAGSPFHLEARDLDPAWLAEAGEPGKPAFVQVDLVNGANVWYTIVEELSIEAAPKREA
jgi:hypothetical protein